ncbi:hypothetical protein CP8484711_0620, partial [Chlamydia psittaci 84-8471/1]
AAMAIAPPLS